jgi:hypothetical protein
MRAAPTSSLAGATTQTPTGVSPARTPVRQVRPFAQERSSSSSSSFVEPMPLIKTAPTVAADTDDGIARLPFVLAVVGALIVGLGAGSRLLAHMPRAAAQPGWGPERHPDHGRSRNGTGPAVDPVCLEGALPRRA